MKTVSRCPCCDQNKLENTAALVAPFLARRIWSRNPFRIDLAKCPACGFAFFNPRLEPDEEERLYAGYRSSEYQSMRSISEPWYTPAFNEKLTDPSFIELRKVRIAEILRHHLNGHSVHKILDYGGARGDIVQNLVPGASAFVYDVSRVQPLNGVIACQDLEDCRQSKPDVVMCTNVLEHVGSPRHILSEIRSIAARETAIWVEVPCETPFGWNLLLRRLVQEMILLVLRPAVALSMLRPGMLHLMHEHVNFFTLASLCALMTSSNFQVTASGSYEFDTRLGKAHMIWALGFCKDRSS